jgi:hypothetical protein
MEQVWKYQLRVYLHDDLATVARHDRTNPALRPLTEILERHDATLANHLAMFEAYLAEAEREGQQDQPLYKWTKATVEDPEKWAKHQKAFELHVAGDRVYPKAAADALEAELQPLVDGDLITRLSRHDTNPTTNMPVPAEYRS